MIRKQQPERWATIGGKRVPIGRASGEPRPKNWEAGPEHEEGGSERPVVRMPKPKPTDKGTPSGIAGPLMGHGVTKTAANKLASVHQRICVEVIGARKAKDPAAADKALGMLDVLEEALSALGVPRKALSEAKASHYWAAMGR